MKWKTSWNKWVSVFVTGTIASALNTMLGGNIIIGVIIGAITGFVTMHFAIKKWGR